MTSRVSAACCTGKTALTQDAGGTQDWCSPAFPKFGVFQAPCKGRESLKSFSWMVMRVRSMLVSPVSGTVRARHSGPPHCTVGSPICVMLYETTPDQSLLCTAVPSPPPHISEGRSVPTSHTLCVFLFLPGKQTSHIIYCSSRCGVCHLGFQNNMN